MVAPSWKCRVVTCDRVQRHEPGRSAWRRLHDLLSRSSGVNNLGVYRGYRNRNCLGALRAYGDPARSFDERAITSVSYGISQIAPVRRLTIYYFDWAILSRHREPGGSRAAVRIDYDAVFRLRHSNFHRVARPGRSECVRKPGVVNGVWSAWPTLRAYLKDK
jgi:hypothetical protein